MTAWTPQVFAPYPEYPAVLFGRVAARSAAFQGVSAAGGAPVIVGSAAGHDPERVAVGARGELLERLGNVMAGREAEAAAEVTGTFEELRARGLPVREAIPDVRQLWVGGRTTRGADVFVPAASAFLHHRPPAGCDPVPPAGSTGVAAHPDAAAAERHAAWEVLERDLVRRSWYGLAGLAPEAYPAGPPEPVAGFVRAKGLTATAFLVPAPAGTACAVVCLHRPDGSGQAFGARCGPADTIPALVEKAAYEAIMVRWSMNTAVARGTWDEWQGRTPPATAVQHALWTYHGVQDSLRLWDVRTGGVDRDAEVTQLGVRTDPLAVLADHTGGQDVIVVETSGKPARDAGVRVVRILAPGAHPLPSGNGNGSGRPDTSGNGPDPTHPHPHPFG